jgi:glucoamylase
LRCSRPDTPTGPVWHRNDNDGYGEHADGSGFDGTEHRRGFPLLTDERGHCALCAGEDVMPYIEAMMAMSNAVGLMREQVWDAGPISEHSLSPDNPIGSTMPLAWTHAEFAKLCHGLAARRPVDRPQAAWERYRGARPKIAYEIWGPRYRPTRITAGRALYVAVTAPALVPFGINGWRNIRDINTEDTLLGVHIAKLPTDTLNLGDTIEFTFYCPERDDSACDVVPPHCLRIQLSPRGRPSGFAINAKTPIEASSASPVPNGRRMPPSNIASILAPRLNWPRRASAPIPAGPMGPAIYDSGCARR